MPDELDDQVSRSLEDYWAIAFRRRWWILLPLFLTWAAVWGVSWLLPSTYQSEALILVEQQKVPDQYVIPNVTTSLQGRLQGMTQQILSRTRLQATIDRFHLYPQSHGLNGLLKSGDPVEQMRDDINIELVQTPGHPGEFTAFKMRYSAESPQVARKVNSELTRLFIEGNQTAQRELSENTTDFLVNELAAPPPKHGGAGSQSCGLQGAPSRGTAEPIGNQYSNSDRHSGAVAEHPACCGRCQTAEALSRVAST